MTDLALVNPLIAFGRRLVHVADSDKQLLQMEHVIGGNHQPEERHGKRIVEREHLLDLEPRQGNIREWWGRNVHAWSLPKPAL